MTKYSRKELKKMLRPPYIIPMDAPAYIHRAVEEIRLRKNREAPTNRELVEEFMQSYNARRFITSRSLMGRRIIGMLRKSPGWLVRFRW